MTHLRDARAYRPRMTAQSRAADPRLQTRMVQLVAVAVGASFLAALLIVARPAAAHESFADLAEQLLPAVVNISSETVTSAQGVLPEDFLERFGHGNPENAPRAQSLGSGFIIDGEAGIVITNNHVIEDASEIKVILQDDTEYTAELVGSDPSTDVAVLRIDTEGDVLPEVPWGDSDAARVGDWVLAIGNPLGLGGTVTAGIISARGRNIDSGPYDDYIQTDASINRGNSGGPLFNTEGQVIGINTAIFSQSGGSIGIGFSIPSNQAIGVVDQILEYGSTRRGWLGVSIQEVTDDIADSLGMDRAYGALVSAVHEDGPAESAGFESGDVIIEFNNNEVADTRELLRLVAAAPIEQTVPVIVWRNGEEVTLNPTLGQREKIDLASLRPIQEGAPEGEAETQIARLDTLGIEIAPLNQSEADKFGVEAAGEGVLISSVDSASDAAEKGIQPGDIVLEVNQNEVASVGDMEREVQTALEAGRSSVLLKIQRGDRRIFVAVRFAR